MVRKETFKKLKIVKARKQFSPFLLVVFVILVAYSLFLLTMLGWGFLTSFKNNFQFDESIYSIPKFSSTMFNNYKNSIKYIKYPIAKSGREAYLIELFYNSITYTLGCAFVSAFVPFVVGYVTARYDNIVSKIINTTVLVTMMIPIVGNLPAQIEMAQKLGIYNTLAGAFIMQAHFLGMYYLLFYSLFKSMPKDYSESAKIDGASNTRIMFRIMMPMGMGAFWSVFLLRFIFYWDDYSIPLVFLTKRPTLSLGMLRLSQPGGSGGGSSSIPFQMAGAMIFLLPVLLLFLIFRKRLMNNVTIGGIKE